MLNHRFVMVPSVTKQLFENALHVMWLHSSFLLQVDDRAQAAQTIGPQLPHAVTKATQEHIQFLFACIYQ
jgi:hypothetical protein